MLARKPSTELEAIRRMTEEIGGHERERKEALRRLLAKLEPEPDPWGWPMQKVNGDD